jgi:hypothetical protein
LESNDESMDRFTRDRIDAWTLRDARQVERSPQLFLGEDLSVPRTFQLKEYNSIGYRTGYEEQSGKERDSSGPPYHSEFGWRQGGRLDWTLMAGIVALLAGIALTCASIRHFIYSRSPHSTALGIFGLVLSVVFMEGGVSLILWA